MSCKLFLSPPNIDCGVFRIFFLLLCLCLYAPTAMDDVFGEKKIGINFVKNTVSHGFNNLSGRKSFKLDISLME